MLLVVILFLVFLVLSLELFYHSKFRLQTLFISSIVFLAFIEWMAVVVLLINICIAFLFAQKIEKDKWKDVWFFVGIALILFQLIGIKWWAGNISFSFHWISISIGLSFYALQNISYLIDVRAKKIVAETNLLYFSIFNSFFPKILCGPIMKYQEFKPQLLTLSNYKEENLISGINRFIWGLTKKIVLADHLALMVKEVFDTTEETHGFTTLIAAFIFTLQVYIDFSSYTDMAIGISRMFGFNIPENFAYPFSSKSFTEFWRRWNITLMKWLNQHLYFPILFVFRKNMKKATFIAIAVTLLFSALWHGVGATFIYWGISHIAFISIEMLLRNREIKVNKNLRAFITIAGISFANIFFRAKDVSSAKKMMSEIFSISDFLPHDFLSGFISVFASGGEQIDFFNFIVVMLLTLLFFVFERRIMEKLVIDKLNITWLFFLIAILLVFGVFSTGEEFIYARF